MNNRQGSGELVDVVEDEDRISLNDLPDELLTLIFNRLLDPKCLCLCSLVSPRFSSLILLHVHCIHFAVPRRTTTTTTTADSLAEKTLRFLVGGIVTKPFQFFRQIVTPKPLPCYMLSFYGRSFYSAFDFLKKFKSIRYLHLVLPSPPNVSLFKWTASFGASMDTFVFLITSSFKEFDFDEQDQEDPLWTKVLLEHRVRFAFQCVKDAITRHGMLRSFISKHHLLENITITDSKNQGILSSRDSNVVGIRNWFNLLSPEDKLVVLEEEFQIPANVKLWHVPVLKLPVSKKVMVSATLFVMEMEQMVKFPHQGRDWGDEDAVKIATLFSEQGEEEFAEAVVEIMVNHTNKMKILL